MTCVDEDDPFQRDPINQPPVLTGHDTIGGDPAIVAGVGALAGDRADTLLEGLTELGRLAGSAEAREHGWRANRNIPVFSPVDRFGRRVDRVDFDPSWHWLMRQATGFGLHGTPWLDHDPHAHLRRAAGYLGWTQVEFGHACPITMTYAAVPALAADPVLAEFWTPRLADTRYDPRLADPMTKTTALAGMGMTEKQGGSDVRTNLTVATPSAAGELGAGSYRLRGHKWFTSAPMNDVFLMLGRTVEVDEGGGLTCFVVPRFLPGGGRNGIELIRLKDKLGNRANASAELELRDALAVRLGDQGAGVRTIIEMVAATRLDCVLGSAAVMRRCVAEAVHHAVHRSAFGMVLLRQPAMTNVLADLAIEAEAAILLGLRLAHAVDRRADPAEAALRRIAVPVAKFWVCKRAPMVAAEAIEVLGGNGYVEDSGMPIVFRESPLNSIWEGSGNVNALDVLRALRRTPEAYSAWRDEVLLADETRLGAALGEIDRTVGDRSVEPSDAAAQFQARRLASRMAVLLQGSLLVRFGAAAVADAFIASRVAGDHGGVFGTLPAATAARRIVERNLPDVDR